MTALERYCEAYGSALLLRNRTFTLAGVCGKDEMAVATFTTTRSEYLAVLCVNSTVYGRPGAEVWSIIGNRREIARFAIHNNMLLVL